MRLELVPGMVGPGFPQRGVHNLPSLQADTSLWILYTLLSIWMAWGSAETDGFEGACLSPPKPLSTGGLGEGGGETGDRGTMAAPGLSSLAILEGIWPAGHS